MSSPPRADSPDQAGRPADAPAGETAAWFGALDLYERALGLPADERAAWLRDLARSDPGLHAELERLLQTNADADTLAESPLDAAQAALRDGDRVPEEIPSHFGVYRVLRLIGVGGMGLVYEGERNDGEFELRVAIKQLSYPTPGLLQRFRQERQILARLEHPNIAHLIDGGVDAAGAPYFVMEYVDGVPITRYVHDHGLDLRACLQLFLRVCAAVQFAHQNLVVHRDLKPANILVTREGAPKLLDFGIAKLLATTGAIDATQTAARMLTPGYAAPEQFSGAGVTTATDVYSLGIVLYELLTGVYPSRGNRNTGDFVEPPAPSTAVARDAGSGGSRRQALRGDLDRIVLKALAVDPARRYASVEALATDIGCYLDGRPIAARGDSRAYILRKFVERNRVAVLATAAVLAAIVVGAAVALFEAHQAREQARRAEMEARTSEEVKNFIIGIFEAASPDEALGRKVTAIDLLQAGSGRIAAELRGQPRVQAEMYAALSTIYLQLEQHDDARRSAERGLELAAGLFAKDDPVVLALEKDLGKSLGKSAELDRARAQQAAALLDRVIAVQRGSPPEKRTLLADALESRGSIEAAVLGDLRAAADYYREAVEVARARGAPAELELSRSLAGLAEIFSGEGRFADALPIYREAIERREHSVDPRDPVLLETRSAMAYAMSQTGQTAEAESILREVAARQRDVLGESSTRYADTLNRLLLVVAAEHHFDEAERLAAQVLPLTREVYGEGSAHTAAVYNTLSVLRAERHDYAGAAAHAAQVVRILDKLHRPNNVGLLTARNNLAAFEYTAGDLDAAQREFEQVLKMREQIKDPLVWITLNYLGNIARRRGDAPEAERLHRDALSRAEQAAGSVDVALMRVRLALAQDRRNLGELAAARADAEFVVARAAQARMQKSAEERTAKFVLAQLDYLDGRCDRAMPTLQELQPLGDEWRRHWSVAEVELLLGLCQQKLGGHYKEAAPALIARSDKALSEMPALDPFYKSILAQDLLAERDKRRRR